MLETLVGQPEMRAAKRVFDWYRKEFEHYHDCLPGRRGEEPGKG